MFLFNKYSVNDLFTNKLYTLQHCGCILYKWSLKKRYLGCVLDKIWPHYPNLLTSTFTKHQPNDSQTFLNQTIYIRYSFLQVRLFDECELFLNWRTLAIQYTHFDIVFFLFGLKNTLNAVAESIRDDKIYSPRLFTLYLGNFT